MSKIDFFKLCTPFIDVLCLNLVQQGIEINLLDEDSKGNTTLHFSIRTKSSLLFHWCVERVFFLLVA